MSWRMVMEGPPFRADHVGSFLRPAALMEARAERDEGRLPPDELRAIEDEHISEVVRRQESVGLSGITDGEFRRLYFHVDFLEKLDGVSVTYGDFFATFHKADGTEVGFRPPTMHVDGPVRHAQPIKGADFDYLAARSSRTP
jgi:5-methyltetrahydropteroyltriglutamate--homocysteine methyltransferase